MTDDQYFSSPITLDQGGSRNIIIRSVRQAAWFLADRWPNLEGTAFMRALGACAAVLEGRHPAAYAREALLMAAAEAKLKVVEA